jgi:hypothetical protein
MPTAEKGDEAAKANGWLPQQERQFFFAQRHFLGSRMILATAFSATVLAVWDEHRSKA